MFESARSVEKDILLRLNNKLNSKHLSIIIVVLNFILAVIIFGVNIYIRSLTTIQVNIVNDKQVVEVVSSYADYYEIITIISSIILIFSLTTSLYIIISDHKKISKRLSVLVGLFDQVGLSKIESDNKVLTDNEMQVIDAWNRSVEEIDYLNELREKYFKNMVHDIKTPIQILSMNIEMLKLSHHNPDDDEFVLAIDDELKILEKSVTNFLMIEKITFFEKVESADLNIDNYFQKIIDRYARLDCRIVVKHNPEIESIYTDEAMFSRIVENLIDNAIKYGIGKKITIVIEADSIVFTNDLKDDVDIADIFGRERHYSLMGNGLGVEIINTYIKLLGWSITSQTSNKQFIATIKY